MSRKITFLTLFLWLMTITFPVIAQQKSDTIYTFRFVPQKDMFYVPWSGNDSELVRLFEFVDSRKSEILEGKMHIYVCGYCNSMESRKENLKTAAIRSNRVKSELIIKKDLTEECFVTHNYVTNGDFVTVRMEVPVVQQEAVDEEEHPDLENNQNIEKSVLAEIEKKITEPKISEQKDAEPVQNLESAEIPLEPEMRRWMAGLNVGIPFFWGDMLSVSADKTYVGFAAGIQGGYRISEFLAVSLSLDYAKGKLGARSYAQDYLLAPDGMTWYVPQQQTMSRYADLYSDVSLFNLGLSLDVNVNRLFSKSALKHRFTVWISPAVYGQFFSSDIHVKADNSLYSNGSTSPSKISFGLGGALTMRYRINNSLDLQLKNSGIWMTDNNFDGIRTSFGKTKHNAMWLPQIGIIWNIK